MRRNHMKAKIKSGEPVFGVCIPFPAPEMVEIAAQLGFDWVLLDCEHGSMTPDSVLPLILAAEARGITPIVRPESGRPEVVNRYLDRGAMGVQMPHVNTLADAQAAVRACKYHPAGERGLAGGRAADFGLNGSVSDYVKSANDEILVCVQIEHSEAVDNLHEILQAEDVDVFFVGPSDLSQSMGFPGQQMHPEVVKTVDGVLERIHQAGKASGTTGAPNSVTGRMKQGVQYHYTLLTHLLAGQAREYLSMGREAALESQMKLSNLPLQQEEREPVLAHVM